MQVSTFMHPIIDRSAFAGFIYTSQFIADIELQFYKLRMRVIFLTLFLTSSLISIANKIDELKTESEIAHFVDELSGYTTVFPKSIPSNLSHIKYLKIDIDKNGSTDLLVNDRKIFAIVDAGNDKFELKFIGTEHKENRLVGIDTTGSMPILIIKKQNGYQNRYQPKFAEVLDSITYKFNGFIEYNSKPQKIRLQSIKISRERCFGSCPIYDLTIDNNRQATLNAKAYMKYKGLLKAKIDKRSFDEIISLLSYLNPDSLRADYSIDATDNPAINIEMKYNRTLKGIHDYGLEGSLGLLQFYLIIEKLVENQKWR
jgi:hypothetical protein